MTLKILTPAESIPSARLHRGRPWQLVASSHNFGNDVSARMFDGILWAVLKIDDQWFVVPGCQEDEEAHEDIGPFTTVDEAFVFMKMRVEN